MSIDEKLYGTGLTGAALAPPLAGVLRSKFLVPPFTVLNARDGAWQNRKRAWLALGIEGEVPGQVVGRPDDLTWNLTPGGYGPGRAVNPGGTALPAAKTVDGKTVRGDGRGRPAPSDLKNLDPAGRLSGLTYRSDELDHYRNKEGKRDKDTISSTSVFDPVLCELAYTWWCPPGGLVLDPFAGGACRGLVAGLLGYRYAGCELRPEQIAANLAQQARIAPGGPVKWVQGDARDRLPRAPLADLLFTCPPYGDLEQYSDRPEDLSAMDWPDFKAAYKEIIRLACDRLRPDRFAVWVVGDFRDKATGHYRNFPGYTVDCFAAAGLPLYNEAILVTMVASLSMRAGKQFGTSRKLGKGHQNVLVFIKGDARKAAAACNGNPAES